MLILFLFYNIFLVRFPLVLLFPQILLRSLFMWLETDCLNISKWFFISPFFSFFSRPFPFCVSVCFLHFSCLLLYVPNFSPPLCVMEPPFSSMSPNFLIYAYENRILPYFFTFNRLYDVSSQFSVSFLLGENEITLIFLFFLRYYRFLRTNNRRKNLIEKSPKIEKC